MRLNKWWDLSIFRKIFISVKFMKFIKTKNFDFFFQFGDFCTDFLSEKSQGVFDWKCSFDDEFPWKILIFSLRKNSFEDWKFFLFGFPAKNYQNREIFKINIQITFQIQFVDLSSFLVWWPQERTTRTVAFKKFFSFFALLFQNFQLMKIPFFSSKVFLQKSSSRFFCALNIENYSSTIPLINLLFSKNLSLKKFKISFVTFSDKAKNQ